ncbi:hypothetical protein JY651_43545 [Pyxidicoccus parkwayensis]|uniref:HNH domain-containing protein n=1 Tax=Pyxidicoccus parkwayensis TaxID=2813578 RepID=A0ABX7NX23_9BACT|nr:hypothetical protein [Pyxidicoccus parkwaysis]QSQ21949.1 hypothetical protein JY651_43545 [Pyxidicoccus parkwaysis]
MIRLNKGPQPTDSSIEQRVQATQLLTQTFQLLVAAYTELEKKLGPGRPISLTNDIRQWLSGRGVPDNILKEVVFGQQIVENWVVNHKATWVQAVRPLVGFGSGVFDSKLYANKPLKQALVTRQDGKCAYCETRLTDVAHGDVEHFRPKAGYLLDHALQPEAYYWCAYDWDNLYFACQICNETFKGNRFPIMPGTQRATATTALDASVLIDPGTEEPRDFIRFNPLTAKAYPYDVLRVSLTPQDLNTLVLLNPDKIDEVVQRTMATGVLSRGASTINILGLNRATLVRARAGQLRQLRALLLASLITGTEQAGVQQALAQYTNPGPGPFSPEYLSASVDALLAWQAMSQQGSPWHRFGWIASYDTLIATVPPPPEPTPDFSGDDSIMYLVRPDDPKPTEVRRLVYVKKDQELDQAALDGWFVAVNLETEGDDKTSIVTKSGANLTLSELVAHNAPWNFFKKGNVFVTGEFTPLFNAV